MKNVASAAQHHKTALMDRKIISLTAPSALGEPMPTPLEIEHSNPRRNVVFVTASSPDYPIGLQPRLIKA